MVEDLMMLVNNTPSEDLDLFTSKTNAIFNVKKQSEKVTVDYSWVDHVNEAIPYIDNIIRNPRRFIVQEEEVFRIEQTKKVTQESIKHLAQHTALIQEVDDKGFVKPLKLLNVFKEETIDLYENRFIFTLVNNLHTFIYNQSMFKDEESYSKDIKTVNYETKTKFKEEDITMQLSLRSSNYQNLTVRGEKAKELKEKIEHIKNVINDFKISDFMKTMVNATPVRSPIRKTNIILKDHNFKAALALWDYLEHFQLDNPLKKYHEVIDLKSPYIEQNYLFTYFLNYTLLNFADKKKLNGEDGKYSGLKKLIFDTAKNFDNDENELGKIIINELKLATAYKQDQIKNVNLVYKAFIKDNYDRRAEALLLIK